VTPTMPRFNPPIELKKTMIITIFILVVTYFLVPIKKIKKIIERKQKNIAVKRRYRGAEKMAKDWMRKLKNTKIEI
jgi:F0F1-type ATP synthase membrane subunit b/b'